MGKMGISSDVENQFRERTKKIFFKIEKSHLLNIVRRGLTMLVPVIVLGGVAHAIRHFPNERRMVFLAQPR